MSSHEKGKPIEDGFCGRHLGYLMSCSDDLIAQELLCLPAYDLARLRRLSADAQARADAPEKSRRRAGAS